MKIIFKNISSNYSDTNFIINVTKEKIIGKLPVKFNQDSNVFSTLTTSGTLIANNCGFKNKIIDIKITGKESSSMENNNHKKLILWDFLDQQNGYEVDKKYFLSEEKLISISNNLLKKTPNKTIRPDNNNSQTIRTKARIRKLTPREAYRLMGLKG